MQRTRKLARNALSWFLCILLIFGWGGVITPVLGEDKAYALDVGANPTPKVDIAVAVPSDYPGTFLDFKAELTEKLIAQGMSPSDFRITDTATKIDTTDQSNWYVYDHYYDRAQYDALGYTPEQQKTHPFRPADNTKTTGAIQPMSNVFRTGTSKVCLNLISHTYSFDEDGKANMVFAGYGTYIKNDFMFYPATTSARRTISFDLDAAVIDKHTLDGAGFLLNAGIDERGLLQGYAFYIVPRGSNTKIEQTADAYILKITDYNPLEQQGNAKAHEKKLSTFPKIASTTIDLGAAKKLRISVDLQETKVTVQSQPYDANGNLIGYTPTDNFLNQPLEDNDFNGFGPIVGYTSHGCSSLTVFKYLDLEMRFESSAFDALKTVQYYQSAEQKYFINLVGSGGDAGIPDPTQTGPTAEADKKTFDDGINRMNENETFYLSNVNDGFILRDTEGDQQGLGSTNGFIATGESHVDLMAQYIYQNFNEGARFQRGPVTSALPLANFYMKNVATGDQLMTVHLQHLANATDDEQGKVKVNIVDKSLPGTSSQPDGAIAQWRFRVLNPDNTVANPDTANIWYDDVTKIPDFEFTADSAEGRYIFELTVRDNKFDEVAATDPTTAESLHQSTQFQTYIVAFNDTKYPVITGANTRENVATITLTDTGNGIDEDGITFIEDNRGSGVAAYYVTYDRNEVPAESDWIKLPYAQHSVSFEVELNGTDPLFVWSRDECGNVGYLPSADTADKDALKDQPAEFQPTRVVVEDINGNVIKEYYVIGENPIIVLPPDDQVPDPDDPENEQFAGWQTPGGVDVTPGSTPDIKPDDDNTIVIRPTYSRDYAKMVYLGNGGKVSTGSGDKDSAEFAQVVSGSSILKKIDDHAVAASRTGYTFTGWRLLNTDDAAKAADAAYVANPANSADISSQIARKETADDGTVTRDTYYLVAQWEVGNYTLRFNANGGSLGRTNKIENVAYDTVISSLRNIPTSGTFAPSRPGYFFMGWSTEPVKPGDAANYEGKIFKKSDLTEAAGVTEVASPTMPESDLTVYAVWQTDHSKTLVSFDSDGGSPVKDQAYSAAETSYTAPLNPSRSGYTFVKWVYGPDAGEHAGQDHPGTGAAIPDDLRGVPHTFVAQWKVNDNTRYTIDYYVNSGNKDASGENYVYTKVTHDGYTKTATAPTESTVSIPDTVEYRMPEIALHDRSYWYNPDNPHNVFTGTVTGNPPLSLRLYYDRYLNISVTKSPYSTGTGEMHSVTGAKEGSSPTVTWSAAPGSKVTRVAVNGIVRDDLIATGSYTPDDGLWTNEYVVVKFDKDDAAVGPDDPDGPVVDPDPDNPVIEPRRYVVTTALHGCTHGSTITETQVKKPGEDAVVTWNLCDKCTYLRADVDGQPVLNLTGNQVELRQLSRNHTVDVYVTPTKAPSIGAGREAGFYTITVNRYGGDAAFTTSSTRKISASDAEAMTDSQLEKAWTFSWDRGDSVHRIYEVKVNGTRRDLGMQVPDEGSFTLRTKSDYVIDVYFFDLMDTPGSEEDDPDGNPDHDYVAPDLSRLDEWIHVNTKIVGGAGTIDPSFVAKKEAASTTHEVSYRLENSTNYGDPEYMFYAVESVTVNNEPHDFVEESDDGNVKVTLTTESDADVVVTVKPLFVNVTTNKVTMNDDGAGKAVLAPANNGGSISASRTVGKYGDYVDIFAVPAAGYRLHALDVTDVATGATTTYTEEGGMWTGRAADRTAARAAAQPEAQAQAPAAAGADEAAAQEQAASGAEAAPAAAGVPASSPILAGVSAAVGGAQPVTPAADPTSGPETAASADPMLAAPAASPTEPADAPATEAPADDAAPLVAADDANPQAAAAPEVGAAGITLAYADDTAPARPAYNTFTAPSTVTADGKVNLGFANITQDKAITAYFVKNEVSDDDSVDDVIDNLGSAHKVTLRFEGIANGKAPVLASTGGAIADDGTGYVADNGSTVVSWGDLSNYEVESVTVNGKTVPVTGNSLAINDITEDTDVVVTYRMKNQSKVTDVAPTGFSDKHVVTTKVTGIGTLKVTPTTTVEAGTDHVVSWKLAAPETGEGGKAINRPYIMSFKINGEEQPAYHGAVDADGAHTFKALDADQLVEIHAILLDEDADGDGKPDYNIDTDGDGDPDLNVDTDGDGLPDLNVDTDGDGEPDVNVDTDGDGKPDENIVDRDNDGQPENVDPLDKDADKRPNVNVVVPDPTDPDKKKLLNEDTDGDGKPDLNIVDENLDGKSDPIDPANPPLPNVNVVVPDPDRPGEKKILNRDTNGDGIPDIDIVDKDGDGRPDPIDPANPPRPNVNVDTDGDDQPDLFIDVDGDYRPDVNIDTDGDGRPDINIDVDGDGHPDINVDTDGYTEWKPSTEGGNADGIWKPYLNIDVNDGKGPVHTDNTPAVDADGDGVDDRWKPGSDRTASNGFAYDTMDGTDEWTNDGALLEPGEERPESPADPETPLPGTGDGAEGDGGANAVTKVATKLAKTGDDLFITSFVVMTALTSMVALFIASLRRRAQHGR
ncbi:MAG: hypothetical protein HFJ75_06080 [Eggerthellaceae bacterium]|nr:hypothetical protein [Eggerthellaceae bacterium]